MRWLSISKRCHAQRAAARDRSLIPKFLALTGTTTAPLNQPLPESCARSWSTRRRSTRERSSCPTGRISASELRAGYAFPQATDWYTAIRRQIATRFAILPRNDHIMIDRGSSLGWTLKDGNPEPSLLA
jgi:hypothetical protein